MKFFYNKKKGFTIIEVLIASSIFVVITTISTAILLNTISTERTTRIRNSVYDDTRVLMELFANYIATNAIDYEEYYSQSVVQPTVLDPTPQAYGLYYGVYGSRFYDPRLYLANPTASEGTQGKNPDHLGVQCTSPFNGPVEECDEGGIYTDSIDAFKGLNFFNGTDDADAFCDETNDPLNVACTGNPQVSDDLYLISPDAARKTIFVKQKINEVTLPTPATDYTVGILEMEGIDSDSNGNIDLYRCLGSYNCEDDNDTIYNNYFSLIDFPTIQSASDVEVMDISLASPSKKDTAPTDLNNLQVIPVVPFRTSIKSLKFIINPAEDPYRAVYEVGQQVQPSVTIIVEAEPSAAERAKYPGGWPEGEVIRLQRTVNSGVYGEVKSYPTTNNLKWICKLLKGEGCE